MHVRLWLTGKLGEAFGYYGRAWSHNNIRLGSPYLLQLMLILGSAPLLAATVYMTLGRFVRSLRAEKHTIMRSTWVTKIYVLIDVASFICQMMGSAMQGSGDLKGVELGQHIVIGGLIVQLVALAWFLIECTVLHRRLRKSPTFVSRNPSVQWQRTLWTLHSVTLLIFGRSLYRLIEFLDGSEGYLATHEAYLYAFDASLLSIAALLLALFHPGRLFTLVRKLDLCEFEDGAVLLD